MKPLLRPLPRLVTLMLPLLLAQVPSARAESYSAAQAASDGGARLLRQFVERSSGASGRIEVTLGQLDPRIRLAPCARIEPFLPPGVRLWGRSTIGVRCVEGANWTVSLPVTVSVFGPALVANTSLAAGRPPVEQDFRLEEVDLTREAGNVVTDATQLVNRVLARPLAAGQALRADHLKVPATIASGDPVKVRVLGEGFSIAAEAVALAPAGDGQTLRVRTENGKILSGTVRDRIVEVRL